MKPDQSQQTTRCFVCDDEQQVGVVERGQACLRLTPEGLRCCGRYVGLYQPRHAPEDMP